MNVEYLLIVLLLLAQISNIIETIILSTNLSQKEKYLISNQDKIPVLTSAFISLLAGIRYFTDINQYDGENLDSGPNLDIINNPS